MGMLLDVGSTGHSLQIAQTDLSVGVLTVLLRSLAGSPIPFALRQSIFYCILQYLVTPALKNTS